jgi:hypothetical protein
VSNPSNGDPLPDGDDLEDVDDRHRALADRLRRLRWPEPPEGVRERRLAELRDILARGSSASPPTDPPEER